MSCAVLDGAPHLGRSARCDCSCQDDQMRPSGQNEPKSSGKTVNPGRSGRDCPRSSPSMPMPVTGSHTVAVSESTSRPSTISRVRIRPCACRDRLTQRLGPDAARAVVVPCHRVVPQVALVSEHQCVAVENTPMGHRRSAQRTPGDEDRSTGDLVDDHLPKIEMNDGIRLRFSVEAHSEDQGRRRPGDVGCIDESRVVDRSNRVSSEERPVPGRGLLARNHGVVELAHRRMRCRRRAGYRLVRPHQIHRDDPADQ